MMCRPHAPHPSLRRGRPGDAVACRFRTLGFTAWVLSGALATASPATAQSPAPITRPRIEATLGGDSLYIANERRSERWDYRLVEVEGREGLWVEVEDPFGGRVLISGFFTVVLGNDAREYLEGEQGYTISISSPGEAITDFALFAIGLLTVIVLPFVWFRRRYRRERDRRRRLQESSRQLAASREDERLRIARDLHDGPLQNLHALHMQLDSVAARVGEISGAQSLEARRLRGAQDEAHTVIGELRRIAEALRPPALGPFGLAAALRAHTRRFCRQYPDVRVDLVLSDDQQAIPLAARLALFRVAQEAMTNAAKHSDPTRIAVHLRLLEDQAELVVEDDGGGFEGSPDDPALVAGGHFGLLGMRERIDAIGGDIEVISRAGAGVRVWSAVPLSAGALYR